MLHSVTRKTYVSAGVCEASGSANSDALTSSGTEWHQRNEPERQAGMERGSIVSYAQSGDA